jgi:hypothetical protein
VFISTGLHHRRQDQSRLPHHQEAAGANRNQGREALKRVAAGEPLREIALTYNVDHSTIHRLKARYAAEV